LGKKTHLTKTLKKELKKGWMMLKVDLTVWKKLDLKIAGITIKS
jgi:hypothetical protein